MRVDVGVFHLEALAELGREIEDVTERELPARRVENAKLLALAITVNDRRNLKEEFVEPRERVLVGEISKRLKTEGQDMSSWQVSQTLQELGFERKLKGGEVYFYTGGKSKLAEVANALGIEDDYFKDETGDENGDESFSKNKLT